VVIIKAIAYSGLPEWKYLLGKFVERMPARKVLIRKYMFGNAKTLEKLPMSESPFVLDAWWGHYYATGAYEPARHIVEAVALADEKGNVEKLTAGSIAKWTLATNSMQDKPLLDFLRSEAAYQPKKIGIHLREVITAAEMFETEKLRKKAIGAIATLKTKGPESHRRWVWWGQAGQIALALGCVAASVAGQVEFGIPCIVGGALSSAALKYFTLPDPTK